MYYINYDEESGEILGIYPSSENYDDVPSPKIAITDDEFQLLNNGYYRVQDGALVEVELPDDDGDNPPDDEGGSSSDNEGDTPYPDTTVTIEELQAEYAERFEKLKKAYIGATIMEDNYTAQAIQEDYRALLNEFTRKAIDIEEGSSSVSTNNYCEICGTQIIDGVCPNCRWRQ